MLTFPFVLFPWGKNWCGICPVCCHVILFVTEIWKTVLKTPSYQAQCFSINFLGHAPVGQNIIPHVAVPRKRCRWAWHSLSDGRGDAHILPFLLVAYSHKEVWAEMCENPAFRLHHASSSLWLWRSGQTQRLPPARYLVVIGLAWKRSTQLPHKYHKVSSFEEILGR